MEFNPEAVEIFTSEQPQCVKYRLCVGYVIGGTFYYMRKFGRIHPLVTDERVRDHHSNLRL